MNEQMPFERVVAGWMADEAGGAPDEALERILSTTRRLRPQPRWWALVTESPMRMRTTRVAVGLPNRRLVLLAALLLLLIALVAVAVGSGLLLRNDQLAGGDWSGFRGNADHSGVGIQGPTGNPVLNWRFPATGAVLEVAIIGDRVFFASDDGRLRAVSRDRGVQQWSVAVPDPPLTGPYAADGRLYLIDATGVVRAFAQADGTALWTSASAYDGPSRVISVDGTVYSGTSDGFLVALDGATGAERWRLRPVGSTQVDAPAFGSGLLFAGTAGAGFVAVDPATRQVVWSGDTGGEDTGTAAVADGIAYIGVSATATSGKLRAFDAKTGRLLWTAEDDLLQLPTVEKGVAYTATPTTGLVAAIDTATGATKWRIRLNGEVRAPVVVNGVVYVYAGIEQRVYAIDAASGGKLWQFDVTAYGNCCIAVAKGAVWVGLQDGSVYSIGGDGASLAAAPFPTPAPAASGSASAPPGASASAAPLLVPVAYTWTVDLRDRGFAPICQIAVDPSGRVWAPEADTGKIAIISADGKLLEEWAAPADAAGDFDFSRGNGDCYGTLAFEPDGSFFVLDVGNRRVQAFDRDRRFVTAWGAFGQGPGEFTDPVAIAVAADRTIWVLDDVRSVLEHYDRAGKVLGSFDPFSNAPLNKGANSMTIGPNGHFYVTQVTPNQIAEFGADGTFLGAFGQGFFAIEQPTHMAVDADGRVFVTQGPGRGESPGVTVFAADGTPLGGFGPVGTGDGQIAFPAGIALDGAGSVYVMDSDPASARLMKVRLVPPLVP